MQAADNLVDIIRDLIQQELDKHDTTVLCRVAAKIDDSHYDLYVMPDTTNIIHNVVSIINCTLSSGDYCYVYKIKNNLTNAFICYNSDKSVNNINLTALAEALDGKESIDNKTQEVSDQSTTDQYPSARAVYLSLPNLLRTVSGYDATKTQTLQHVQGTFLWVDN